MSLGFDWKGYQNEALLGFFTGPAILGIGTIVLVVMGYLTFIGTNFDPLPLLIEFLLLIMVAFIEELMFRGYLLHNLLQSLNKWIALLISALVFGVFHAANPDVSPLAVINVFVAGCLLGINYIYTRNLWFGIFFHFSWNFFQGPVQGYDVSGLELQSILQQTLSGNELFTGGQFGFEGSVLCPILLVLATAYFAYLFNKMYQPVVTPTEAE
jgi:membrane protease YdiL (CAAX protease family)